MFLIFSILRKLINSSCLVSNFIVQAQSICECVLLHVQQFIQRLNNYLGVHFEQTTNTLHHLLRGQLDKKELMTIQIMVPVCNDLFQNLT